MRQQGVFEVPTMSPDPRVRVFRRSLQEIDELAGMEVDAYVVLGETYVTILDTLVCPADMAALMLLIEPEIGNRQLLCVNSHADWDHTWGNSYFRGPRRIPILGHEAGLQRVNSPEARQELAEYQARSPLFREVQSVPPTLTFQTRLTIHDGAMTIELLHAPGHCRDHLVAWLPHLSLLLTFDTIEEPLPCIEERADAPLLISTLERLEGLHAHYVLCSHSKTATPVLIQENLAYLREIVQRSRLLLARQRPTEAECEQAAKLIGYPFDKVVAQAREAFPGTFYRLAHEENARALLLWLINQP
jgi:glyoxylase-like metal-dependent hydrolase (beta-lactamase superfamily II)